MAVKFTENEIKALESDPYAIRALADWHSCQETMANAIGTEFDECCNHHSARRSELRAEATRIESEY